MEPPREKYNSVRNFLDKLGNEKVKICRNCNAVFSYTYETTVLCLSCDFEEEVSTLPSVVEIEDEFEVVEAGVLVWGLTGGELDSKLSKGANPKPTCLFAPLVNSALKRRALTAR